MLGENMNTCIAIFTNRTHTLIYYAKLKNFGVSCKVRNTPKGLGSSCSIAVEFSYKDLNKARAILNSLKLNSFKHIFIRSGYGMNEYKLLF